MAVNERETVLDSLMEILEKGQYSHMFVKTVLDKYDYLLPVQKAFIKKCIDGTVEKKITLDYAIDLYAKTPVNKQKPLIRTLLRMSTYQLLYMDKVPDSAVCNEAVKLAGKRGFRNLSGFVNGVLRSISKNKDSVLKSIEESDEEIKYSIPKWILSKIEEQFGVKAKEAYIEYASEPSLITLRKRCKDAAGAELTETGFPNAYYLKRGVSPAELPGFSEGNYTVADISSQTVCVEAGIKNGDKVLDVCAAPGGKTLHAYDLGGDVISCDISDSKIALIEDNLRRCHADSVKTLVCDASEYNKEFDSAMDVVIADLPCSGLGVINKKPDIRYRVTPEDIKSLQKLQRKILENVSQYVKPGGILMYSTCTVTKEENEDQVEYILNNLPFELVMKKQFLPGIDNTDGFFVSKFKKVNK